MLGEFFTMEYWIAAVILITALQFVSIITENSDRLVYGEHSRSWGWLITIIAIFYIGLRPLHMYGDSWLYSTMFSLVQTGQWKELYTAESEWLWDKIEFFFIDHSNCQMWFLCIAVIYIGGMALAIRKWFANNFTSAMVFAFTAMSFHAYATNGLRSGVAGSLVMLGLAFLFSEKRRYVVAFVLMYLGMSLHSSFAAVIVAAVLALFFNDAKTNTIIWCVCVLISYVFSDTFVNFLTTVLGDDRMRFYSGLDDMYYANKGFRFDFIIYSSVPIVLGWIVCVKNGLRDGIYEYILAVYTIVNAGWVLINTIAFSNRFAYLSWFLYPVLMAYPFLKFRFMENQSRMAGLVLLFHLAIFLVLA